MNLSLPGAMELIGHEGIVQTRYRDSVGVWTIGVGHTAAAGPPDPKTFTGSLTIPEVIDLFRKDVARYVAAVNKALKVPVSQTQFDALVSFHFNTGAIARASLTKFINSGNIPAATNAFMAWVKPPEIIRRRRAERDLFANGTYSNRGMATIFPATAAGKVLWGKGKRVDLAQALKAEPPHVA